MNSDKSWFDVDAVIRVRMRTHGYSQDDACARVQTNLEMIDYNPVGWDDRELVDSPNISIVGCEFYPQGYRLVEPGTPQYEREREPKPPVEVREGVFVEMCQTPGCVLAADHPAGQHRTHRVSAMACPHNVPNFGPDCSICD